MNKFKPPTTVIIGIINLAEMIVTHHTPASLALWPLYGIYCIIRDQL
jgi:hypothetical protein